MTNDLTNDDYKDFLNDTRKEITAITGTSSADELAFQGVDESKPYREQFETYLIKLLERLEKMQFVQKQLVSFLGDEMGRPIQGVQGMLPLDTITQLITNVSTLRKALQDDGVIS